ncbi:5977_t:CDS:2, partial [Diversispora eburnea]
MVYYFTSAVVDPPAKIYMGKDKEENEELIKYGWEEDFHVHPHSSAHVYLRLQDKQSWENLSAELLNDCGQLVKDNSKDGRKEKSVTVVYTPWSNLMKTSRMETGEVSFHNQKLVKKMIVDQKDNKVIKRLEKTKIESYPDLNNEKLTWEKEKRRLEREAKNAKKKEELRLEWERKELANKNPYESLFNDADMRSNYQNAKD